jgi:hypothetical protein
MSTSRLELRTSSFDDLLEHDDPLPYEAAIFGGEEFLAYRRRGGRRIAALPDFYIGAHAAVAGHQLLTRGARWYRTYFPRLVLIAPEEPKSAAQLVSLDVCEKEHRHAPWIDHLRKHQFRTATHLQENKLSRGAIAIPRECIRCRSNASGCHALFLPSDDV